MRVAYCRTALAAVIAMGWASAAAAQNVVVHDNPWGYGSTINAAAGDVFGAGNWTQSGYTGLNAATLFSGANSFVYLEGGNGTDVAFANFVASNTALIETWVSSGGRLLLNAATWGVSPALPFQLALTYNLSSAKSTGVAADAAHPLFSNLGYGNPGTTWTGSYFAHNNVSGSGSSALTALIRDGGGATILAGGFFGAGYVMVGGLTNNVFHTPQAGAEALTRNMMHYTANVPTNVVPEPISMILLGTGLAGVAAARRRRRVEVVTE
jgi:hypothetical protein